MCCTTPVTADRVKVRSQHHAATRGNTALPAAFSQVINLTWFKRKESKTDKRVLLETEGREEDLQLLILQNTGG